MYRKFGPGNMTRATRERRKDTQTQVRENWKWVGHVHFEVGTTIRTSATQSLSLITMYSTRLGVDILRRMSV